MRGAFGRVVPSVAALWTFVAFGAVADLSTTYIGLQRGAVEMNPIPAAAHEAYGFLALVVLKALVVVVTAVLCRVIDHDGRHIAPGLIGILWLAAAVANLGGVALG